MTCEGKGFIVVVIFVAIEEPLVQRSVGRQPVEQACEELIRASRVGAVELESGG